MRIKRFLTQKEIIKNYKETRVYVISFDATGKRVMTYGNLYALDVIKEIMKQQSAGNTSLIMSEEEEKRVVPFLSNNINDYLEVISKRGAK